MAFWALGLTNVQSISKKELLKKKIEFVPSKFDQP
jgi:hypothetical protein